MDTQMQKQMRKIKNSHRNTENGTEELCGSLGVLLTQEAPRKLQSYNRKRQTGKIRHSPLTWQPEKPVTPPLGVNNICIWSVLLRLVFIFGLWWTVVTQLTEVIHWLAE